MWLAKGRSHRQPRHLFNLANQKDAENEGEQEDQLKEDEREQHCVVDLLTGFRLSSHALKATVSGQSLTDSDAKTCDSNCESNS